MDNNNNRNAPATKGDIEDVLEAVRGIETKLLSAFYGYAKTNDNRVLEVEGNEAIIRSRMSILEARVLALEEKSNTPPAA